MTVDRLPPVAFELSNACPGCLWPIASLALIVGRRGVAIATGLDHTIRGTVGQLCKLSVLPVLRVATRPSAPPNLSHSFSNLLQLEPNC